MMRRYEGSAATGNGSGGEDARLRGKALPKELTFLFFLQTGIEGVCNQS